MQSQNESRRSRVILHGGKKFAMLSLAISISLTTQIAKSSCEIDLRKCAEIISLDSQIIQGQEQQLADYMSLVEVYKKDQANMQKQLEQTQAWYMSPYVLFGLGVLTGIAVRK
jgi:hypothetical protein